MADEAEITLREPEFVHLRVHSAYSLLEGAITVKELASLCAKQRMPAVAITDNNNLFGSLEFSLTLSGAGVQPIVGCQLSMQPLPEEGTQPPAYGQPGSTEQLVLLVHNETGYYNLLELVSKAHLNPVGGHGPLLSYEELEGKTDGLIALSGGTAGALGRYLLAGRTDDAVTALEGLKALFPNRFYVELQRHGMAEENQIEASLIKLAYDHNVPLVATNEAFFPEKKQYEAHDALMCVAGGNYVTEEDRRRLTAEHYFKSQAEMVELFSDIPEAVRNTVEIAKRCAFMAPVRDPILPSFVTDEEKAAGIDEAVALREQSAAGLEHRLKAHVFTDEMDEAKREEVAKPYRDRLEYELGIIIQMQFPGYFLIVSDFIKWAKEHDIPVGPGRGSGAGSVVAWALLITDLDPLRYGLLFERFLNPERVSMPDFDVDFCQEKRDRVIHYVQQKYGASQVAQIITFGKLQARAVLRDVGRVLQMPYGQVDRICKLVPNNPANPVTLQEAINMEPMLKQAIHDDETVSRLVEIALQLEGLYRHASTHAAGVVIGDRPLEQLVPMYRDPKSDMPVIQYSMKYAETAGLVKFDFLGLKTLSVLQQAVKFVKNTEKVDIDLLQLPEGDESTYRLLANGETVGVFQFESAGMRDALRKLQPDCLEDLIALGALYRPGPMDNIPKYIACKHGREDPDYLHPMLEEVLRETYGVIIYQEQVQKIAQIMGGYTLGGADLLRRAMGKKIKAEMDNQRVIFTEGAVQNGVPKKQASEIFDLVAKFAGYGFNKSHAAAYALIAYQTAYLKANYPVEFIAASMNYDMHNTDKLSVFRQEAQRMGIEMLPPDVNHSEAYFSVEQLSEKSGPYDRAIRYGLAALKNVGEAAMEALVAERQENGPFTDLFDFAGRLDTRIINRRAMENLVKAGALDNLHGNRQQLFESIDVVLAYAAAAARDRESNQVSLFGDGGSDMAKPALKASKDWQPLERLQQEFSAVGFYLSAHPLEGYAPNLKRMGVCSSSQFPQRLSSDYGAVKLAGIVTATKTRVSDRGRFAFVTLSDIDGVFEISIFDETLLSASSELLQNGTLVIIQGEGKMEEGGPRLIAQSISALDEAVIRAQRGEMCIQLANDHELDQLRDALSETKSPSPRQGVQVKLLAPVNECEEIVIALPHNYLISPVTVSMLESFEGVERIWET